MEETASLGSLDTGEAAGAVKALREYFRSGTTASYAWRRQQLHQLIRLLTGKEQELMEALMADSGKAELTAYSGDVVPVRAEAKYALKHLKRWMKPERVATPLLLRPGKSRIHSQPLGVVLIIGAWSFPIHLTLGPLVAALAAGNTVLIKPSELSPRVAAFLSHYIPAYFDSNAVKVLEGGVTRTTEVLEQRFDKIFFTGSSAVGRIVMEAAARNLTPVTLELGGKNPCIVHEDANLEVAANRIVAAKFFNAGQVCVAPDYLLVHEAVHNEFIAKLKDRIQAFYGSDPSQSSVWSTIINERHYQRILRLLDSGSICYGGDTDAASRYIGPTLLTDVAYDAPVMREEVFGPVLPVLKFRNLEQAIKTVNDRERALALYLFTEDQDFAGQVLSGTSSGGVCINSVMRQASNPALPFGGVGQSGVGAYHGRYGFEAMSHQRSVMYQSTRFDPRRNYPPFSRMAIRLRKRLSRWLA